MEEGFPHTGDKLQAPIWDDILGYADISEDMGEQHFGGIQGSW